MGGIIREDMWKWFERRKKMKHTVSLKSYYEQRSGPPMILSDNCCNVLLLNFTVFKIQNNQQQNNSHLSHTRTTKWQSSNLNSHVCGLRAGAMLISFRSPLCSAWGLTVIQSGCSWTFVFRCKENMRIFTYNVNSYS